MPKYRNLKRSTNLEIALYIDWHHKRSDSKGLLFMDKEAQDFNILLRAKYKVKLIQT